MGRGRTRGWGNRDMPAYEIGSGARLAICVLFAFAQAALAQQPAKSPQQPPKSAQQLPKSAQQLPPKSYRIGVLSQGNPPTNEIPGADFRQGLRDWKYVEGRDVAIEFRYGAGKVERLPELADELVRLKVDVIVTVGDSAAVAAKKAT